MIRLNQPYYINLPDLISSFQSLVEILKMILMEWALYLSNYSANICRPDLIHSLQPKLMTVDRISKNDPSVCPMIRLILTYLNKSLLEEPDWNLEDPHCRKIPPIWSKILIILICLTEFTLSSDESKTKKPHKLKDPPFCALILSTRISSCKARSKSWRSH